MFCGNCGAKNEDGAKFCASCGALLDQPSAENVKVEKKNKNSNHMLLIGIIVIVAVVIFAAVFAFSGRGYKSTVNKYMKYTLSGNIKGIVKLIPNKTIKNQMDENGIDKDELNELIEDAQEDFNIGMRTVEAIYGEDIKFDYEITGVEDLSGSDFYDVVGEYSDMDTTVKAAKVVEVELEISSKDNHLATETIRVPVIKVGRAWYIDVENLSGLF